MPEQEPAVVAIVDDDRSIVSSLKDLMESAGHLVRCFGSAEEFLASDGRHRTGCLVTDIRMPGMSGLALQATLNAEGSRIPLIFITARDDRQTRRQAIRAGAAGFLSKPFDHEVLVEKVQAALEEGGAGQ